MRINYSLVQAIEKFHRFLGDDFKVPVSCLGDRELTLKEIANLIADRLVELYRPNDGRRPALATQPPFSTSSHWQGLLLFYEHFEPTPARGSGRHTRPAGPGFSQTSSCAATGRTFRNSGADSRSP